MERWAIDAGELRHLVTIQAKSVSSPDTRGHPARTWADSIANVNAKIETPSGRKLELSRQLVPDATHSITMRYRVLDEQNHRLTTFTQVTTLGALANTGDTTISATTAISIPNGTVLLIDSEQMQVTAVSGNTLTVSRGYNGTTAAGHANAANVLKRRVFQIGHQEDVEEMHVKLILTCTELKGPTAP